MTRASVRPTISAHIQVGAGELPTCSAATGRGLATWTALAGSARLALTTRR
jgi:hypothetical protein